ncbi:hypothetical protein FIB96_09555 [Escherichia coli]|nr:hypothetical protein FIB96_09555 [Escherichia coli]TNT46456.1 hypothetical protein FIB91_20070 [Escherichia coli]
MLLFFEKIGRGLFLCAILPLLSVKTRVNNMEAIMRKIMRTVVIGATLLLSPCVIAGALLNKSNFC